MKKRKIVWIVNACLLLGLVITGVWKHQLQEQTETDQLTADVREAEKPDPILHIGEKTGFIHGDWETDGYSNFDKEKECGVYLNRLEDPAVQELIFGKYCIAVSDEAEQEGEEPVSQNPFAGCPALQKISVEADARWMAEKDGMLLAATGQGSHVKGVLACIPAAAGELKVPDGAVFVKGFNGCRKIKGLSIPASVTTIPEGALGNMSACTRFTVDTDNKHYCVMDGVIYTKDKKELVAYPAGKKDAVYRIPDGTEYIRGGAFMGADHLQEIQLPRSLQNERMDENTYAYTGCKAGRVTA